MLKVKCCKDAKSAVYYMRKRKEFCLQFEGEEWWAIIKYCPWCGKHLDTFSVDYDTTQEMDSM